MSNDFRWASPDCDCCHFTDPPSPLLPAPLSPLPLSPLLSPPLPSALPSRRIDRHCAPHLLDMRVPVVLPITHQEALRVGALSVVGFPSEALNVCSALNVLIYNDIRYSEMIASSNYQSHQSHISLQLCAVSLFSWLLEQFYVVFKIRVRVQSLDMILAFLRALVEHYFYFSQVGTNIKHLSVNSLYWWCISISILNSRPHMFRRVSSSTKRISLIWRRFSFMFVETRNGLLFSRHVSKFMSRKPAVAMVTEFWLLLNYSEE